ncbi:hypothetical protein [Oleisolibacter albus]|uniref:hypothetical protein n=1 Tax=Oleisolibacter albus TaxID=2171757 RepID=UPI000DF16271|nr:hypothetical protein [Oleisolibacter albus]
MTRLKSVKTSFTGGELSPELLGRGDLRAYENGAARLRNVLILPTGGVVRRPGTAYLATLPGPGRLVAFTFNNAQQHVLAFTDHAVTIVRDGLVEGVLATPWAQDRLSALRWAQSADVLLLCHPEVPPQRLSRLGEGRWRLEPWTFAGTGGRSGLPVFRFADPGITLTPSGTSGRVRLTASAPVFQPGHEGQPFHVRRKAGRIAAVRSPILAELDLAEDLPDAAATDDWQEAAFSPVRGWPVSVCFHQDRLVIGGSRDLPNRLWLSRSGALFDFGLGTGEDDAAIEFAILSDEVNPIRAVVSGRHLQVFTTGGEWAVTGQPLTPAEIRLDRQTRIGSPAERQVPPRDVDGATLFAGADGSLREFQWADLDSAYQANDLSLTARHLLPGTVDLDYDRRRRLALAVQRDGTVAALTLYRAEQVMAWTRLETAGRVLSLALAGGAVHWLVERDGRVLLEVWDADLAVDCGLSGRAETPTPRWAGLEHLSGRRVAVVADGMVQPDQRIAAGKLRLGRAAAGVAAGLRFTHVVEPLPPNLMAAEGQGRCRRLLAVTFRLQDTPVLRADLGQGPQEVPLRRAAGPVLAEIPAPPFTGDRRLATLGWSLTQTRPHWRIEEDRPLPFTLLAALHELKVND